MAWSGSIMYEFVKQAAIEAMELYEQYGFAGITVCIACGLLLLWKLSSRENENVPPGNLGLPIIGETFGFLQAQKKDKSRDWVEKRIEKYGPIFKTSLLGCPTVVMTGKDANRFLFSNDCKTIVFKQPPTVAKILGKYNLFEINGEEHKRLRGAMMAFLKREALQKYVARMEMAIEKHLDEYWKGKDTVTVVPLMKRLSFDVACASLFSLTESKERDDLLTDLTAAVKSVWSLPFNLPGTAFRRGLNARSRICKRLSSLIQMRKIELQQGKVSPAQDLISCLLTLKMDGNDRPLSEEEIIDNVIVLMIAGHDTTALLLCLLVRLLAKNPTVYQNIVQEHVDIITSKQAGDALTWEDIQKMKYTWRVAQETLRMTPVVFGGFRKAVKDIQYGSYTIPKGWQLFWESSGTHMSNDIFPDADKFDPSRFESERASIPAYSYVAFGAGPRICAGYEFAKVEIALAMHHLVTKYRWSLIIPDEPITRDPIPYPAMGLPIRLELNKLA